MPFGWVAAGSAILGAVSSNNAANKQEEAANNATAAQKAMFDTTQANVAPWMDAGKSALSDLSKGVSSGKYDPASYGQGAQYSPMEQLNGVGAPYLQSGVSAAPSMSGIGPARAMSMFGSVGKMGTVDGRPDLQTSPGYTTQANPQGKGDFTLDKFHEDPGYQFQLQQGLDALTNRASVAGGMNSNNMKGLIGYAEGMANTDYQNAFQNYQTDANRTFGQQQTGLQDYIQQFMVGQNTTGFNNSVGQQKFSNDLTGTGFNNNVTQQQYQDAMQTTGANNTATQQMNENDYRTAAFNNSVTSDNFKNQIAGTSFNNENMQNNLNNYMANSAYNNSVTQQKFNNRNTTTSLDDTSALQHQQLNNADLQQQYSNLMSLSEAGRGAALNQAQVGTHTGQSIGNSIIGAGNAAASGQIGVANAIGGGLTQGYNSWLQNQYMNPYSSMGMSGNNASGFTYDKPWEVGPQQGG